MVNISDIVLELDQAMRWPEARRWLMTNYGSNAYIPLMARYTDANLEPCPPEFEERWALITFSIEQEDGAQHTYFYLEFQDPDDELVFRLKWL